MEVSVTYFITKPAGRILNPFQTDGCLLFLMTSREGDSCLLNLHCEPKEASISNFMLHITIPLHIVDKRHPNRIITKVEITLKNYNPKIKPVTTKGFK